MNKFSVIPKSTTISPYKVTVIVEFKKAGNTYDYFDLTSDMDRLSQTITFCRQLGGDMKIEHIKRLHQELIRLRLSEEMNASTVSEKSFQYMCTIVLNYLCHFIAAEKVYEKYSRKGAGIIMKVDTTSYLSTEFIGMNLEDLKKVIIPSYNER